MHAYKEKEKEAQKEIRSDYPQKISSNDIQSLHMGETYIPPELVKTNLP
jgi:hypothetical protein